ncbi:MAG: M42 family metallopeptidase [Planctomycetes bacterium]|nr:M42 family metallopeptidase [Planctomycetota bacterium]
MRKQSLAFLEELLSVPSPSGFEQRAQAVVREYLKDASDEVTTDVHGNVIACLNPGAETRVMLAGHVDEVGLMVTHITDKGFIYFAAVGGVDAALVPGLRVHIHTKKGDVLGVIGKKPIHHMDAEDRKRVPKMRDLWIDIGAKDGKDAARHVRIGDSVTFTYGFERLLNNAVVARGFDNRIGVFIVAEVLRTLADKKLSVSLYTVSTVQEELGLRGARTSAFGIDPHAGIAVDVGFATDFPEADQKTYGEIHVGKGPMVARGANVNPVLGRLIENTGDKKKIPYQVSAEPRATGTDANAIQVSRAGAAAALISIPNRYMHTPVEVVSLTDTENAVKLIAATVQAIKTGMDFTP